MKELNENIKKNGYNYSKVKIEHGKKHKVAMYKQQSQDGEFVAYEIFIVKTTKEKETVLNGVHVKYEASEHFPSDEEFGKIAWSCRTFDDAEKKFQELLTVEEK